MPKNILKFINKEISGINEAAILLGGFTLFSQILALIRDRLLASQIGASTTLDIYYAAFRIPDFLYISIASLASVTVILPFLIEKIKNNQTVAKNFLSNLFSAYMLFMVISSIIIYFSLPNLAKFIAPGFNFEQTNSLITISRIMLLSPIFIGLSNLIGSVTQLYRNFFIFALSPIFYNIGILVGIIFLYPRFGITGLSYGVILGAFLHLCVQVPNVLKHKLFPVFSFNINWVEIANVAKSSLPRTLTLSANSIALLILVAIASNLKDGSISLFTFAFNLQSVPVGIIGISYSVAAFPMLAKSYSNNNIRDYILNISIAAKQIIFWTLPAIALIVVLRAQIVRVILGSEIFSWSDTKLTAASLSLFVISLITQSLVLLFVRAYYAASNTIKPLAVNIFSSVMVIIFAYIFLYLFKIYPSFLNYIEVLLRVENVEGTKLLSLPLAYALGSILNFFLIYFTFKKDYTKKGDLVLKKTFIQSLVGALTIGIFSYLSLNLFSLVLNLNTFFGIFLQGLFSGLIGITFGLIVLLKLKNEQLIHILGAFSSKFKINKTIAQDHRSI